MPGAACCAALGCIRLAQTGFRFQGSDSGFGVEVQVQHLVFGVEVQLGFGI